MWQYLAADSEGEPLAIAEPVNLTVEDFTYIREPERETEDIVEFCVFEIIDEEDEECDDEDDESEETDDEDFFVEEFIPPNFTANNERPIIALTFDDGPSRLTSCLLDILDEYGGRVTFCVIGNLVEGGAETVLRAFEAGHEIVGHSWNHQNLARLSVTEIKNQIELTSAAIEAVTGEPSPPLFRAPFGNYNTRIRNAAAELGYGVLNWSIDPKDWRERDEEHIYDFIMENARDGAIVVLHDVHPTTIDAMREVIPALIEHGFELVTVSEVITHVYGEIVPGFEFTGTRR